MKKTLLFSMLLALLFATACGLPFWEELLRIDVPAAVEGDGAIPTQDRVLAKSIYSELLPQAVELSDSEHFILSYQFDVMPDSEERQDGFWPILYTFGLESRNHEAISNLSLDWYAPEEIEDLYLYPKLINNPIDLKPAPEAPRGAIYSWEAALDLNRFDTDHIPDAKLFYRAVIVIDWDGGREMIKVDEKSQTVDPHHRYSFPKHVPLDDQTLAEILEEGR